VQVSSSGRAAQHSTHATRTARTWPAQLPACLHGPLILAAPQHHPLILPPPLRLCRAPPRQGGGISVLVMSPTRELASQIAKEAEALLKFHPFKAQVVYGGTNINRCG
jgi:ATP-dependent RNA helicase MSS116